MPAAKRRKARASAARAELEALREDNERLRQELATIAATVNVPIFPREHFRQQALRALGGGVWQKPVSSPPPPSGAFDDAVHIRIGALTLCGQDPDSHNWVEAIYAAFADCWTCQREAERA